MDTMGYYNTYYVEGEILSLETMFPHPIDQDMLMQIHSNLATTDPDVMYLHKAMKSPDKEELVEEMDKEIIGQFRNKKL